MTGNENNQATIDQQINYAANAGIDYWAFVNGGQTDLGGESYGLQRYLSSSVKSKLGFTIIVHNLPSTTAEWSNRVNTIVSDMQEPTWVKVTSTDRPLLYLFGLSEFTSAYGSGAQAQIDLIRTRAQAAGLPNPYIVAMNTSSTDSSAYGLDALGAYASYPGGSSDPSNPSSYATLAQANTNEWASYASTGSKFVPLVSAGWNQHPRDANPPPWGGGGAPYFASPTPTELANHVIEGLDYVKNHTSSVDANTMLIYAWNEVAEGGWLVPTVGEGTSRLDTLKSKLDSYYAQGNLVSNPGFETGSTSGWSAQSASIAVDTTNPHTGSNAVKISSRSAAWGAATQDVKSALLANGQGSYAVSAWTKFASGSDTVNILVNTVDSAGSHWFGAMPATVGTSYTQISGTMNLTWTGTLSSAVIYTQSTSSTADLYEDDFSLSRNNLVSNPGFETGTSGWAAQSASISSDTTNPHTGSNAVRISGRSAAWGAATQNVTSALIANGQGSYAVSTWAKFASGSDTVNILVNTVDSAGSHWFGATPATVGTSYTQISGTMNLTWTGTLSSALVYTQGTSSTADLYEDDFSLTK